MSGLENYTDARELLDEYLQAPCPECGTIKWFKETETTTEPRTYRYCESCSTILKHVLEYPCPECGIRMVREKGHFYCKDQDCTFDRISIDTDELVDRLSGNDHFVRGMPGVLMGECPVCHDSSSVNGGPDGGLECSECTGFYAGQYSDQWLCYAIWMETPGKIRVRADL